MIVTLGEAADNKEEIAEEILGSKVADGPAAETWLSSEDKFGRNELGNCEAWDAMADRMGPEPIVVETGLRVFPTAPTREEAAAETLADTVPEGPTAEIWDRREDRIGCAETGRSDA